MKRTLFTLMTLLLFLGACAPAAVPTAAPLQTDAPLQTEVPVMSTPGPIVIVDALDRTVTLPGIPERIVITGKGLFMIADAVYLFPQASQRIAGLGNASQGSSNFISLLDPAYDQKAILTNDAGAEQIAAMHPDLVIFKSALAETVGQSVELLGIPVVYVDFETPEQYKRDLAILGAIFQNEARAEEVAAYYEAKVGQVEQTVSAAASKPRVLLLYYSSKDGNIAFNVPPVEWMQTRLVEMAGGEPAWTDASLGKGWTQVTLEQIAAWNADMIFVVSYNPDPSEVVAGLKADANWQAIRAVQDGQLFAFAGDIYSWDQPDPRWVLGLTWLAGRIHPDLFPGLDITAEAQAFYQTLYGLDNAFFEANILPAFKGDVR